MEEMEKKQKKKVGVIKLIIMKKFILLCVLFSTKIYCQEKTDTLHFKNVFNNRDIRNFTLIQSSDSNIVEIANFFCKDGDSICSLQFKINSNNELFIRNGKEWATLIGQGGMIYNVVLQKKCLQIEIRKIFTAVNDTIYGFCFFNPNFSSHYDVNYYLFSFQSGIIGTNSGGDFFIREDLLRDLEINSLQTIWVKKN